MGAIAILFVLSFILVATHAGNLTLSNTLGSNMVLQRAPASANLWGWAAPSASINVAVQGPTNQQQSTTAHADGSWLVSLTPTAAGGPYVIAVTSSDGSKVVLQNILFGEVWICGGQSNMQFTVACGFNSTEEAQAANNYPNIRVMTVGTSHYSSAPMNQLYSILQNWSVASSASVGLGQWTAFSAVCWFTGKALYDQYQVPIGLISSNWGGTVIQAWSSPTALKVCNVTSSGTGNEANSVLYNAMIVPFQKQVIKGALWYQGEQNAGEASLYSCMFPAMISDWRANFAPSGGQSLPFFFVQLAATVAGTSSAWADQRQAQLSAYYTLPNVGYATAVDLGDPLSPFGNVHPRDKQDVGKRLAAAVRSIAYGDNVVWQGPTFKSADYWIASNVAYANVTFTIYGTGGLVFKNSSCPITENVPAGDCANWQILLSNGNWYPAVEQTISGNTVLVSLASPAASTTVKGVSYAYASWPVCTLFSEEGLPAIPFKNPPTILPPTLLL